MNIKLILNLNFIFNFLTVMLPHNQIGIYKLKEWINIDRLDLFYLSENPNAIHLLEKHPDKIFHSELSTNPEIFTFVYDYEKMKSNMKKIRLSHELLMRVLDPDRLERICNTYNITLYKLTKIYS